MPELPEVETIKRGLENRIIGQKLTAFREIDALKSNVRAQDIQVAVVGQKVSSINRLGKVLIWDFDNEMSLLFHLKMTGQIIADTPVDGSVSRFAGGHPTKSMDLVASLPDNSTRALFEFGDETVVYFNDQRKFGWIKLLPTSEIYNESLITKLGPEPKDFHTDEAQDHVRRKLKGSGRPIKAALLDQEVMAGVGNIYADESLHLAQIHPERTAQSINEQEFEVLLGAISEVIERSIKLGGTSFTNYVNVLGTRGDYLETSRVFKREGQPCRVCGNEILKTKVAGRGTHICIVCQKL